MDPEEDEIAGSRPGTETTGESKKAAKPSSDLTEPTSPRRGSRRRVVAAVTSADPQSDTQRPLRVLRDRGAGRIAEPVNATCKNKTTSMHPGRGKAAVSRSKNTSVMQ